VGPSIKVIGAVVSTVVTAAIALWWLYVVYQRLGVKPEVDKAGNVVLDEYGRAKDILLVVLPLFTAALAYWTGSAGTTQAKQEATATKKQLNAVLDSSPEGVLEKAKHAHPEAFANT
jgi:hypothetical protein